MTQSKRRLYLVLGFLFLIGAAFFLSLMAVTWFYHPDFSGPRFWSQSFSYASHSWRGFLLSIGVVGLTGGRWTVFEKRPIVQFFKAQVLVNGACFLASFLFFIEMGLLSDLQSSDLKVILSLVSYGLSQSALATLFCLPVSVLSGIVLVWLIRRW